jgi:hypothetical protein
VGIRSELFVALAVLFLGTAAVAQTERAPEAQGPRIIQPGTRWVLAERNRGSFGWRPRKYLVEVLGERVWQGRTVSAFAEGETLVYIDPSTLGLLARLRGTALIETFDPALAWEWPIGIGRSWEVRFSYSDHEHGRRPQLLSQRCKVESYEEAIVPVGPFKAFRVACETLNTTVVSWWSPEIGVIVRAIAERAAEHHLGRGTQETEMILYETPWTRPQDAE